MSDCSISITVRFRAEGFHHWPDAPERRFYLRFTHRHLFHVEVTTPVEHGERQIEFHDLLDEAKKRFGGRDHGSDSCEAMAINLAKAMSEHYGGRPFTVSVFEDGEAGATATLSKVQSVGQRMHLECNAVSAFANCGRALAHLRGSYGPTADSCGAADSGTVAPSAFSGLGAARDQPAEHMGTGAL